MADTSHLFEREQYLRARQATIHEQTHAGALDRCPLCALAFREIVDGRHLAEARLIATEMRRELDARRDAEELLLKRYGA